METEDTETPEAVGGGSEGHAAVPPTEPPTAGVGESEEPTTVPAVEHISVDVLRQMAHLFLTYQFGRRA